GSTQIPKPQDQSSISIEGEDPLDARIARSGCLEQHRQLQECMAERRDWRHCQEQVRAFGACMARRQQRQRGPGPAQLPD
uniref:COA4 factor n=1 Tax=Serinus canaria TaxID=9135 RepID=A0A8C9NJH9_SERCA